MIKYRQFQTIDYPTVKRILQGAGLYDETWDSKENLAAITNGDRGSILVAVAKDTVVGCIYIIPYGVKLAYLFRLAVDENNQNQGIASGLVDCAIEFARKNGVKEIGLFADEDNKYLYKYYTKRYFKTSGKKWKYYWKEI